MRAFYLIIFVFGFAVRGQDCTSPSVNTHYVIEKYVKKKKQLEDPEFLNKMKTDLIQQISTAITKKEKHTTYASGTNETSKYASSINITSSGLIINPQIDICLDRITMSVEKKFINELSRNYLTKVINADTKSINALIQNSSTTNKKFLKEQYHSFRIKEKYYADLIPLALESKKEFSFENYEDFKRALYLLGTKANSKNSLSENAIGRNQQKTPKKSISSYRKKNISVSKQSAGYYKSKTSYTHYKKFGTIQVKGGINILEDFLTLNDRQAQVYNIEFVAGDVTTDDEGSFILGLGFKSINNSKGETTFNDIQYDDNLLQKDLNILYVKGGIAFSGFELYMTYGKSINYLIGEFNSPLVNGYNDKSIETFYLDKTRILNSGFGVCLPIRKYFSLYAEYGWVIADISKNNTPLFPDFTNKAKECRNISFGVNININ